MQEERPGIEELLVRAKAGDAEARNRLFDAMRPVLKRRLRMRPVPPMMRRRWDDSDVIQETLLAAHRRLASFRGERELELHRWFEQILANIQTDYVRAAHAAKRDVRCEVLAE